MKGLDRIRSLLRGRRQAAAAAAVATVADLRADTARELEAASRIAAIAQRLTIPGNRAGASHAAVARRAFDYSLSSRLSPEQAFLVSLVRWRDDAATAAEQSLADDTLSAFLADCAPAVGLSGRSIGAARAAAARLAEESLPPGERLQPPAPPPAAAAPAAHVPGGADRQQPVDRDPAPRTRRARRWHRLAQGLALVATFALIAAIPFLVKIYTTPLTGYDADAIPTTHWIVNPAHRHEVIIRAAGSASLAAIGFDGRQGCLPYQLFLFDAVDSTLVERLTGTVHSPMQSAVDGRPVAGFDRYQLIRGIDRRAYAIIMADDGVIAAYRRGMALTLSMGDVRRARFSLAGFSRAVNLARAACLATQAPARQ